MKVLRTVVMSAGLLQLENFNFEGVMRRNVAAVGCRFPVNLASSQPPTESQDVCFKTLCAERARYNWRISM